MKKIIVGIILALILSSVSIAISNAQQIERKVHVFVWTNKQSYRPGEDGTITIMIVNKHPSNYYTIKNITITYPWWPNYADGEWIGNDTITEKVDDRLPYSLAVGTEYKIERHFKVPPDGRAKSGPIEVVVNVGFGATELPLPPGTTYINVDTTPPLRVENLDKIMMLLVVQAILIIVAVVILASSISKIRWQRAARVSPQ